VLEAGPVDLVEAEAGGQLGQKISKPESKISEIIGIAAAMLILVLVFGTVTAMALPIVAAIAGQVPHPVRLAAYNALIALVASDLIPAATFRALYDAWEQGTHGGSGTDAVLRGEELLLTIG